MAIWQFDLHLVPRAGVIRRFGKTPSVIPRWREEVENLWQDIAPPRDPELMLDRLLPRASSWHPDIRRWGAEDANRIDVSHFDGHFCEMLIRIDLRAPAGAFVQAVLRLAQASDLLLLMTDGRLLEPSIDHLIAEIRHSPAFSFVEDPQGFLEQCGLLGPGFTRPAATEQEIRSAETELKRALPQSYRAFMLGSNGGEGFIGENGYLILWPVEEIRYHMTASGFSTYLPDMIPIGTNGGGEALAIWFAPDGEKFGYVPFADLNQESFEEIGRDFVSVIRKIGEGDVFSESGH